MSQLGIPEIQNLGDAVKEGQAVDLKVLEVDPIHHRIVLAATGFPPEEVPTVTKVDVPVDVKADLQADAEVDPAADADTSA
jgi:predicted RNA-binding protein with RPS1 domain